MLYDGNTIEQTLMLNSYNADNAEFGLRSDKLELLAGNYKLIGFYLYDKVWMNRFMQKLRATINLM